MLLFDVCLAIAAFELNGSACWVKVLNVQCYNVRLISNCHVEAYELNDSACWGYVLDV